MEQKRYYPNLAEDLYHLGVAEVYRWRGSWYAPLLEGYSWRGKPCIHRARRKTLVEAVSEIVRAAQ